MQDQPLVHRAEGFSDHISVRFRPGGAHAFLDLPLDELTDRVVALGDVLGAGIDEVRERVAAELEKRLTRLMRPKEASVKVFNVKESGVQSRIVEAVCGKGCER